MRKRGFPDGMDSNSFETSRTSFFGSLKKSRPSLSKDIAFFSSRETDNLFGSQLAPPQSLGSRLSNVLRGKLGLHSSLYTIETGSSIENGSAECNSTFRSQSFGTKLSNARPSNSSFRSPYSGLKLSDSHSSFDNSKTGLSANSEKYSNSYKGTPITSTEHHSNYNLKSHGFTIIGSKSVGMRSSRLEPSGPDLMRLKLSLLETYKRQLSQKTRLLNEQIDKEEEEARLRLESQQVEQPLSSDELEVVNTHFRMAENRPQQLFMESFRISLYYKDISTLRPRRWLNDNVIDMFMASATASIPKSFAFTTHFFTRLEEDGYSAVKRWALRKKINVFEKDVVIVPVNQGNSHWTLAVVNNLEKRLEFYDSMPTGKGERELAILLDYLKNEAKRLGVKIPDYKLVPFASGPCQSNGYDCGVFVCETSRRIVQGLKLNYSQAQMPDIRNRIALAFVELNKSAKL